MSVYMQETGDLTCDNGDSVGLDNPQANGDYFYTGANWFGGCFAEYDFYNLPTYFGIYYVSSPNGNDSSEGTWKCYYYSGDTSITDGIIPTGCINDSTAGF